MKFTIWQGNLLSDYRLISQRDTFEGITLGTINLLESIRFHNAGSSECFRDAGENFADENTAFRPTSPYAIAKAAATWQVSLYRKAYGLYAATGILFNHGSPLRPERFVSRKIVTKVCRTQTEVMKSLSLGISKYVAIGVGLRNMSTDVANAKY